MVVAVTHVLSLTLGNGGRERCLGVCEHKLGLQICCSLRGQRLAKLNAVHSVAAECMMSQTTHGGDMLCVILTSLPFVIALQIEQPSKMHQIDQ